MEVHHHPHVEKRNFKEYFFEFLMIFLAVTMGFIAESLREHISDKAKENEYIINIKNDLATDTTSLNDFIPSLEKRVRQSDSLITLLQNAGPLSDGAEMYYLARLTTKMRPFNPNNTTVTELEHSGNFRLITKEFVTRELIKVQRIKEGYQEVMALDEQEVEMAYPLLGNLFDANVFVTMANHISRSQIDSTASAFEDIQRPEGNPQLRNHNPDAINQLIFDLHERRGSFNGEVGMLEELKKEESLLIKKINTAYSLTNEK